MPKGPQSEALKDRFIDELKKHGIEPIPVTGNVYNINGNLISIRTTRKQELWYDVTERKMRNIDYVIFQTTSDQHFLLIPSRFFVDNYDKLASRSDGRNQRSFQIDWQSKTLKSAQPPLNITEYCCSLLSGEAPGSWPSILRKGGDNLRGQVAADLESRDYEDKYEDGGKSERLSSYYERNPDLRLAAINIHKTTCKACGFNYSILYGEHGSNYIEVHHIKPISCYIEPSMIDPKEDMTVLCSNCHRMIHRKKDRPLSLSELIKIIEEQKARTDTIQRTITTSPTAQADDDI